MAHTFSDAVDVVRRHRTPLTPAEDTLGPLAERLSAHRLVLLGEASHGTHEFYARRAALTERLIARYGFNAVVVEADWPDAYRVNRWVRGAGPDTDADAALGGFRRFPAWMWRNRDVVAFLTWLRQHNDARPPDRRAGFYGMDLYSLHASIEVVLAYLDRIDPEAARHARQRYACLEHFGEDPQSYGYAATLGLAPTCEQEVVAQLVELRRRAAEYASRDGRIAQEEYVVSEQNARVVLNAERYYRTMFRGRLESWNLRDRHMAETIHVLAQHLERSGLEPKFVVWAHNSHLGDARATQMGAGGELNVGQLVRERHGDEAVLVGFTTHTGSVTCASDWGGPTERKRVRPSLEGSYEQVFHDGSDGDFILWLDDREVRDALAPPLLERAVGVIYQPQTERWSHYFTARLPQQFDVVLHCDVTRALERTLP